VTHYDCRNFDLDVLMVYFHGLDAVQHHFWKRQGREGDVFRDVVANYYLFVDEVFGGLRALLPGDTLYFVSSDHGHGPILWYQKLMNIEKMRLGLEGSHARGDDGIFAAMGRGVRRGAAFRDASLFSITPTFLTLMGLPVGRDMDGGPISEVLSDDAPPVSFIDTYEGRTKIVSGKPGDMEEDEALLQRLRDLGYIE
jgi:predicted AlkP superfamily phosphohydrolase/phosphomutase